MLLLVDFKALGVKKNHHMPRRTGKEGRKRKATNDLAYNANIRKKCTAYKQIQTHIYINKKKKEKRKNLLCTTGTTEGRWEIVWTLVQEPTEERPADDQGPDKIQTQEDSQIVALVNLFPLKHHHRHCRHNLKQ